MVVNVSTIIESFIGVFSWIKGILIGIAPDYGLVITIILAVLIGYFSAGAINKITKKLLFIILTVIAFILLYLL